MLTKEELKPWCAKSEASLDCSHASFAAVYTKSITYQLTFCQTIWTGNLSRYRSLSTKLNNRKAMTTSRLKEITCRKSKLENKENNLW